MHAAEGETAKRMRIFAKERFMTTVEWSGGSRERSQVNRLGDMLELNTVGVWVLDEASQGFAGGF